MSGFEKTSVIVSIFAIICLLLLIVFSNKGILDYDKLRKKEKIIVEQTQAIKKENEKIKNEIISLNNDLDYIEHVAKHEHEMASEDELIFKMKNKDESKEEQ